MKLQFNYEIDRNDIGFVITINDKKQVIDDINSNIVFELNPGIYTIIVHQIFPTRTNKFLSWIIFLITLLFRGIFHILLLDTDNKWYLEAIPFYIHNEYELFLERDTEVNLKYKSSVYDCEKKIWHYPKLFMKEMREINSQYIPDELCIKNEFDKFVKKVLSTSFVGIIIFTFFFYKSLAINNVLCSISLLLILCAIIVACIIVLLLQYNSFKILHKSFIDQIRD